METTIVYILLWLGASVGVGEIASRAKGRASNSWFLLSLLISPIIALIVLAVLPSEASADNKLFRKCPACAETVKAEATLCRFCRTSLRPTAVEVQPVIPSKNWRYVAVALLLIAAVWFAILVTMAPEYPIK